MTTTSFTVIVPTRCRPSTLRWALKSCVEQNYDNLEILVSDNDSQDETPEVVAAYHDPRIKYINPGRRLGMAEHWEFALGHATGDYVNYIGDDDAMLPQAFSRLDPLLQELSCPVLHWIRDDFVYNWPQTEYANLINISLWGHPGVVEVSSKDLLQNLQSFKTSYNRSPTVYSGVIQRELLRAIAQRRGRFFNTAIPDVYSGVAIACAVERFQRSGTPYSLSGRSAYSIGASVLGTHNKSSDPSEQFYQENSIGPHAQLGCRPLTVELCVADSILTAREVFPEVTSLRVDLAIVMESLAKAAQPLGQQQYQDYMVAMETIGQRNQLESWAAQLAQRFPHRPGSQTAPNLLARTNSIGTVAYLNGQDFGISNVYEASLFIEQILRLHRRGCFSLWTGLQQTAISLFNR